jgi:hypothetical protein
VLKKLAIQIGFDHGILNDCKEKQEITPIWEKMK